MTYWEILLTKQRERGNDGLTLPFLIGSQNYLPDSDYQDSIEDLIYDMAGNSSFETCIRYCMGTQTLIFEIRNPHNAVYYPTHNDEKQTNLSVSIFSKDDLGESIEEVIQNLVDEFQDEINYGNFSAESNVNARSPNWQWFSDDEDIPFIKESFKDLF